MKLNKELKSEIESLITHRILLFRQILIDTGQIKDVPAPHPKANHLISHCNQTENKLQDCHSEDPVPHLDD